MLFDKTTQCLLFLNFKPIANHANRQKVFTSSVDIPLLKSTNAVFSSIFQQIIQQFGVKLLPREFQGISILLYRFLLLEKGF